MNITSQQLINLINHSQYGVCTSSSNKLIIVIPEATEEQIKDKQGKPVLNWQGETIEGFGFTFTNGVASGNGALQAVRTNGKEVIIINNPTLFQENKIKEKLVFLTKDPNISKKEMIEKIKELLEFSTNEGCDDMYNSTIDFVLKNMKNRNDKEIKIKDLEVNNELKILFTKRDEKKEFKCLELKESGFLTDGPTTTIEKFNKGTVAILDDSNKDSIKVWLVEKEVFKNTYQLK